MFSEEEVALLHRAIDDRLASLEVMQDLAAGEQPTHSHIVHEMVTLYAIARALEDRRRSPVEPELVTPDELRIALDAACLAEEGRWLVYESDLPTLADRLNRLLVDAALPTCAEGGRGEW